MVDMLRCLNPDSKAIVFANDRHVIACLVAAVEDVPDHSHAQNATRLAFTDFVEEDATKVAFILVLSHLSLLCLSPEYKNQHMDAAYITDACYGSPINAQADTASWYKLCVQWNSLQIFKLRFQGGLGDPGSLYGGQFCPWAKNCGDQWGMRLPGTWRRGIIDQVDPAKSRTIKNPDVEHYDEVVKKTATAIHSRKMHPDFLAQAMRKLLDAQKKGTCGCCCGRKSGSAQKRTSFTCFKQLYRTSGCITSFGCPKQLRDQKTKDGCTIT